LRNRVLAEDGWFWSLSLAAGGLLALGCLLPGAEVAISAYVGAGDTQRGYDFARTLRLGTYVKPESLAIVVAAPALIVASVFGLARGTRIWIVLPLTLLAVAGLFQAGAIADKLYWAEGSGTVRSCDTTLEQCAGGFLAPAVRDLQADVLRRRIARHPEFGFTDREGYRARQRSGFKLVVWTLIGMSLAGGYRTFRFVIPSRFVAAMLVVLIAGAIWIWLFLRALFQLEG
jgi:hypothetical protein